MPSSFNMRVGGVNLGTSGGGDSAEMPEETPFRLLVVGNFHGNRPSSVTLAKRKPLLVDRDNFDEILAKLAPSVTLPSASDGASVTISFRELDDFEPDRLFDRLPLFDDLRTLQQQLSKPATFAQAAAKIRDWVKTPSDAPPAPTPPGSVSAADLLEELFEERRTEKTPELPGKNDWQRFLGQIVGPQLVEKPDPRQSDYEEVVEEAIGAQKRTLLHHPDFQALESAWRGLFLLVKQLPTDEKLTISLLDVGLDEWRQDLAQEDPSETLFFREVVQRSVEKPWAAFVSLETFGVEISDLEILAQMNMLAARVKVPILAAGSPRLAGCPSLFDEPDPRDWKIDASLNGAWQMIRGLESAQSLGLFVPRFLLRLPYGSEGAKTERFAFEEMPTPRHDQYLWGPGSLIGALLLGKGFAESGWNLQPDDIRQLSGFPVHIYDDEGERTMKPCAEVHLRDTALEAFVEQSLMVLASVRDRDSIRLIRFQSAATGTEPLVGRWGS